MTKTELLEEFRERFEGANTSSNTIDAQEQYLSKALDRYRDSVVEEERKKFLSSESQIIGEKTKDIISLIDKNKDVFERLKNK